MLAYIRHKSRCGGTEFHVIFQKEIIRLKSKITTIIDIGKCATNCVPVDPCATREGVKIVDIINETDKRRASYYNFYTGNKWGKLDNYDIAINASTLGIDGAADAIIAAAKRTLEE